MCMVPRASKGASVRFVKCRLRFPRSFTSGTIMIMSNNFCACLPTAGFKRPCSTCTTLPDMESFIWTKSTCGNPPLFGVCWTSDKLAGCLGSSMHAVRHLHKSWPSTNALRQSSAHTLINAASPAVGSTSMSCVTSKAKSSKGAPSSHWLRCKQTSCFSKFRLSVKDKELARASSVASRGSFTPAAAPSPYLAASTSSASNSGRPHCENNASNTSRAWPCAAAGAGAAAGPGVDATGSVLQHVD